MNLTIINELNLDLPYLYLIIYSPPLIAAFYFGPRIYYYNYFSLHRPSHAIFLGLLCGHFIWIIQKNRDHYQIILQP